MILSVLTVRHAGGLALGWCLYGLTLLTPWPLEDLPRLVFLIQSSVPMGVANVAVANMFNLHPSKASALFAVSSGAYLAVGLPVILLLFG